MKHIGYCTDRFRKNHGQVATFMTRGKKPGAAINEAKRFAERMGYRWQTNPDPDLLYDLLLFKPASIRLVKVRQTRYRIDPEPFYEDLFPDELRGLRALPFPAFVLRELWLRTQHERIWRRLLVHELSVGEWNGGGRTGTRTLTPGENLFSEVL